MRTRTATTLTSALLVCLVAAGCASSDPDVSGVTGDATAANSSPGQRVESPAGSASARESTEAAVDPEHSVDPPGPREGRLYPDDMLVFSTETLDPDTVDAIQALPGVDVTMRFSMAQVSLENKVYNIAAIDPARYRNWTGVPSADTQKVWDRVAGGELAIDPAVGEKLIDQQGFLQLGNDKMAPTVHVGAFAPQVNQITAVVNRTWAEPLGMIQGNAILISTGQTAPESIRPKIQKLVGTSASVLFLAPELDITAQQTALLTGGSVAQAVGTFNYTVLDAGRIEPDQSWVSANIRTEQVPILGNVTCHKAMLPQFRAALREIVNVGLADEIRPDQYAGCYYPRFIANSTSLSLHSFGIAVDLNTATNQRGVRGDMDPQVVAIFKKWGFAWGGDWNYTDPMHFEMNAVVNAR